MSDHVVFRKSLPVGVVAMLQGLATPVVVILSLRLVALLYDVDFHQYFVMLSALVAVLCLMLFDYQRGGNGNALVGAPRMPLTTGILVRWVALLAILLTIGFATKLSAEFSRRVLFTWCVVTPVPLVLVHLLLRELRRKVVMDPSNARRVLFAGVNDVSISLAERMRGSTELCMTVDGFFDDRSPERLSEVREPVKVLGRLAELGAYVKTHRIDVIFVALPIRHVARVMQLLDALRDTTASIYYVPDIFVFDLIQARAGEIQGIPVVALCETPFAGYRGAIKRAMDVSVALGALAVLSPLLMMVAMAVKMSSPGPAIFRQRRYGLDGREIIVYKFRTMKVTEDGAHICLLYTSRCV